MLAAPFLTYVAHFVFLRDVWIRTQRAAIAIRSTTNIVTHHYSNHKNWTWSALCSTQATSVVVRTNRKFVRQGRLMSLSARGTRNKGYSTKLGALNTAPAAVYFPLFSADLSKNNRDICLHNQA